MMERKRVVIGCGLGGVSQRATTTRTRTTATRVGTTRDPRETPATELAPTGSRSPTTTTSRSRSVAKATDAEPAIDADPKASAIVAGHVATLLAEEEARQKSLEQRGATILTSSGSLATLLLGLVAIVTKSEDFDLPGLAAGALGLAIVMFTVACIFGVLSNMPASYLSTS